MILKILLKKKSQMSQEKILNKEEKYSEGGIFIIFMFCFIVIIIIIKLNK